MPGNDVPQHSHGEIEELAKAVLGPRRSPLEGGGRIETEGLPYRMSIMENRQKRMDAKLQNGITTKIPPTIWVAIISTLGLVIVQLLATWSGS